MNITTKEKVFLMLVRRAMFSSSETPENIGIRCEDIDWKEVLSESVHHAMATVALEGTEGLDCEIPDDVLTEWQSRAMRYVIKNETLMSVQDELIEILKKEGISGAVIKGSAAAFCYSRPDLRVMGDIDFLVKEEDFERAAAILEANGFVRDDHETNPCHVGFIYGGCDIELHRYVNGVPDGELGDYIKSLFALSFDKGEIIETIDSYSFPVTDDLTQALTLLIHTQGHIRKGGLGIRHLCDWAAFVDKKLTDDLKTELEAILVKIGMLKFFNVLNEICEKYLFSDTFALYESVEKSDDICDMLMLDFVFCGNFGRKAPESLRGSEIFTRITVVKTKKGDIAKVRLFKNYIWFLRCAWAPCEKRAILLPFAFFFVPIRYLWRVITGKRKMLSAGFISKTAKRKSLYDQLELFADAEQREE